MADKTVIVQIDYDVKGAVSNLNELTATIEGERVAQARLKQELEQGKISQKEYSIAVEESKQVTSKANAERKNTISLLSAEKGSANELKAEIKRLATERDKLNLNTVEGRKQSEAYNAKINEMKTALKGASTETGKAGGVFAQLGKNLGSIGGPIGGVIQGIMGINRAALAFIANPIGAVIAAIGLALGALMKYFKGSEEGQNRLNKIMTVFNVIAGNVGDLIQKVGKWIFEAVSKPKETIIALGNLIKDNLINRFTAFGEIGKAIVKIFKGDFKEGFKQLADGGIQAVTGITNATDKLKNAASKAVDAIKDINEEMQKEIAIAKNLADKQAFLDKYTRETLVNEAKDRLKLVELKNNIDAKDIFNAKERLKLIDEENELLDKILERQLFIVKSKYEIKKAQNALSNSTKEDLLEEAQLLAEVYNAEAGITAQRKEAIAKRIEAQNQIRAEEEKTIKQRETLEKNANETIKKLDKDLFEFKEESDNSIAEKRGEEIVAEMERIQTMRDIRAEDLQQTLSDFQTIIDAAAAMGDERVSIVSDTFARIATINFAEIQNSKDAFLQIGSAAQGLTSLILAGNQRQLDDFETKKNAELSAAGDDKDKKEAIERKYAKKLVAIKRAQFKEDKAKALVDAGIATALAVVNSLKQGLPLPGLIFAPMAALLGGIQIGAIAKRQPPEFTSDKFAKGGIIGGLSHSQGGTKFYGSDGSMFEAERGEAMFVLKKDATAEIAALSKLNESYGGRSWTNNKPASHLQDGGEASGVNIDKAVDEAIQRTPIYVRVGDIETGLTDVNNVKQAGVI